MSQSTRYFLRNPTATAHAISLVHGTVSLNPYGVLLLASNDRTRTDVVNAVSGGYGVLTSRILPDLPVGGGGGGPY